MKAPAPRNRARRIVRGLVAPALVALGLLAPVVASAAPPDASCVELAPGTLPRGVDRDALRSRLLVELGTRVVDAPATDCSPRGTLEVDDIDGHAVRVRFESRDGIATEQTAELPVDRGRAIEAIALFAGNVARDEAAEIRARMARRARPPAGFGARPRLVAPPPDACRDAIDARHPVGGDFVPYVGTSMMSPKAARGFSLNAIGGIAGGIDGLEVGGVFDIVTGCVSGLEIAGVASVVGGDLRGMQIGGVVSLVGGDVRGVQIAGVAGRARSVTGLDIGGVAAITGDMKGMQIGTVTLADGLEGAQIEVIGVAKEARGLQLGVVNVAGRIRGAQIGVINVADESDFSLGVVSVVRHGETHLDAWGTSSGLVMAGLEHGSRFFRNVYGVGFRFGDGGTRFAGALGLGGRVPLGGDFTLDLDATIYDLHTIGQPWTRDVLLSEARAALSFEVTKGFAMFGGLTYGVATAKSASDASLGPFGATRFTTSRSDTQAVGFPGAVLGVHLL